MSLDSFRLTEVIPASPELLYATWLSSIGHAEMTGGGAKVVPGVGGKFSAWDGYIWGVTLELQPNRRIVQSWRTLEFPGGAADSRLEISLEPSPEGTRLTLHHSHIPQGQGASYRQGWYDHYFDPMRAYFKKLAAPKKRKQSAAKKAAKRKPAKPKRNARRPAPKRAKRTASKGKTTRKPAKKRR